MDYRVLVTHAYNPSYSEGKDQEDYGSKPAQANKFARPISKISNTKRASGVAQGVGPKFKPRYWGKKKRTAWMTQGENTMNTAEGPSPRRKS
jgi:hypothetical protein